MTLKKRFLEAISNGDLGQKDEFGAIVSLKEFKSYFKDVRSDYVNSFLPAAVIEVGQRTATHTRFVFRVKKGVYRVHPGVIDGHCVTTKSSDTPDLSLMHIHTIKEQSPAPYRVQYIH